MRVRRIRQGYANGQKARIVADIGFLKGCANGGPGAARAFAGILDALLRQNRLDRPFGLIEDGYGPANTEEFRFRQGQQEIAL